MATTSIADAREAHLDLTAKLSQLEALLLMTLGGDREGFASLSAGTQSDYMAACTDLVQSCRDLAKPLAPAGPESSVARAWGTEAAPAGDETALQAYREMANDLCRIGELAALLIEQSDRAPAPLEAPASDMMMRIEALGGGMYDLAERAEQTLERHSLEDTDLCFIRELATLVVDHAGCGNVMRLEALAGAIRDMAARVDQAWVRKAFGDAWADKQFGTVTMREAD